LSQLASCETLVSVKSPLCGHEIQLPCSSVDDLPSFYKLNDQQEARETLFNSGILSSTLKVIIPDGKKETSQILFQCQSPVSFKMNCGHIVPMNCASAFKLLLDSKDTFKCQEIVSRPLNCGHISNEYTCWQFSQYKSGKFMITCIEDVEKPCWNYNSCKTELLVKCSNIGVISCESIYPWICKNGHSINISCKDGIPEDCPECAVEYVGHQIQSLSKSIEDRNALDFFRETEQISFEIHPSLQKFAHTLPIAIENAQEYFASKLFLFQNFRSWLENQVPFERIQMKLRYIPFFIIVRDHIARTIVSENNNVSLTPLRQHIKQDKYYGIVILSLLVVFF
jgi:hypothetical protein